MAEERYLLMKDTPGEKATGALKKIVGISNSQKQVLRGELLRPIPPSEIQTRSDGSQHNFSLRRDPSVTLQAVEDDVSPLNVDDYHLLRAVDSPFERFRVFSDPHWLEWGVRLNVGDQAYVRLPSPNTSGSNWSLAVVRYKGLVKTLPGTTFGVQIVDKCYRGKGTSDGFFQGHQYFKCEPDCALFVPLNKLWFEALPSGIQGEMQSQQSTNRQPLYAAVTSSSAHQSQPSHGHNFITTTTGSSDVDPPRMRFKTNDHVVVFDRNNTPLHGSVRWAGRKNRLGRDLGEMHVGIEMAVYVNPTDVPGAKTGLTDLFVAKRNQSIVIPESLVAAGEAYMETRGSRSKKPQPETGRDPPPYKNDPVAIAREYKMTETEFMAEQKKALKEAESQKKKQDKKKKASQCKDFDEVKQALGGESINVTTQEELFAAIRKEQEDANNSQLLQPNLHADQSSLDIVGVKRQHSWQPAERVYDTIPGDGGPGDIHRHIGLQGKSSSVAQGDGVGQSFHREGHQHHGLDKQYQGMTAGPSSGPPPQHQQFDYRKEQVQEHERIHGGQQHHGAGGYNPQHEGGQQLGIGGATSDHPEKYHDYVNLETLPQEPRRYGQPAGVVEQPLNTQWSSDQPSATHYSPPHPEVAASTIPPGSNVSPDPHLGIGSRIQIPTNTSNEPFKYGVIRWIGEVPKIQGIVAGIELDEYMNGCTDGTFISTGQKFFNCLPGRGMYYPLVNLHPDARFMDPGLATGGENIENPLIEVPLRVIEDQFTEGRPEQIQRYIGDRKGIQGHQNSCYLDASVFGLFALTDAFDEMFLQALSSNTADQNRKEIAELLWKGIVNPLRKNGVVRYESVMALRNKLDELGEMEGIAHAEKDPEEFLNLLFKHTLKVDPFLTIRRPYGDEPEFFVQLFVEYNESLQLPTIGQLVHMMFTEQKLSFTKMPSKLLIQVPRFGKQFKTYDKIIPDLKLNITDLTDEYLQSAVTAPRCFVCNERAECCCDGCASELKQDKVYLCGVCDKRFHANPSRSKHNPRRDIGVGEVGSSLDLLSVICIETSHYVCFTKQPSDDPLKPHKWIFFDSMANRVYDRFNIPNVTECSDVLNHWVYPANGDLTQLRKTPPRDLPEYVRRFTQDVYLCVYINLDSVLYG